MARTLGDVATRLLFENDRVRVWEMDLAPGERSATHRHDLDYVLVQIEGDRIAADSEPDTAGAHQGHIEGTRRAGQDALHRARRHRDRRQRRHAALPRDPDRAEVVLVLGDILRRHARVRGEQDGVRRRRRSRHVRRRSTRARTSSRARSRGSASAAAIASPSWRPTGSSTRSSTSPCIKLGAIVVPVNARFTAAEVAAVVEHAEAETLPRRARVRAAVARRCAPPVALRGSSRRDLDAPR